MARPKGSKNKPVEAKVEEMIAKIQSLPVDETEKAEAIDELEDLLDAPIKEEPKDKKFYGYHPITNEEVWL